MLTNVSPATCLLPRVRPVLRCRCARWREAIGAGALILSAVLILQNHNVALLEQLDAMEVQVQVQVTRIPCLLRVCDLSGAGPGNPLSFFLLHALP